ncbi:MAG: trehalose-phosphatase [Acidimicrobiia bacterium]
MSTLGLDHFSLHSTLDQVAKAERLLVACDFDGTLAPIVSHPSEAKPIPAAVLALTGLAALPATKVAVISGRSLRDLTTIHHWPDSVELVGSHGLESRFGPTLRLRGGVHVTDALNAVVARFPGSWVEEKPLGAAVHYRQVDAAHHMALIDAVMDVAPRVGATVLEGRMVIEVSATAYDKGRAITSLRRLNASDTVIFIGDDRTDEHGFAALAPDDLGVKVGYGPTMATVRVNTPNDVADLLTQLLNRRRIKPR